MNKHKRSKLSSMTKIWRRKAKRVPSSSKESQERLCNEITNKETLNISINPPNQVETSSKYLEETLIEEIPDTSKQSTYRMTQEQEFLQSQEDSQRQNPT